MVFNILKKTLSLCMWGICPPFCVHCKKLLNESTIFCTECIAALKPIVSTSIVVTPKTSVKVFAISGYQDPLKTLILEKIQSHRLASKQLGELMWSMTPISSLDFDYIVPIPLHWTRYAYRGYNQAEVIAAVIAKKSGKPVVRLLKRNRKTVFQSSLPVELRNENVSNAFSLHVTMNVSQYAGKRILLVDDLMTTGSTLKNAARLIRRLHPQSIDAVVAARTL